METIKSRYIGQSEDTARLYRLEEKVSEAITAAAKEMEKLLKKNQLPHEYWGHALPQELASVCEHFGYSLVTK